MLGDPYMISNLTYPAHAYFTVREREDFCRVCKGHRTFSRTARLGVSMLSSVLRITMNQAYL
jgi:hypothetical protein